MPPGSTAPTAADLDHVRAQLAALDGQGGTEAAQIALITSLEQLKGAIAAAQARVTDTLARARAVREAQRGAPAAERGHGLAAEIALAPRPMHPT